MSPADASAPSRLIVHRTSPRDEQSRQILVSVDGQHVGQLLYGKTLIYPIGPGPHTLGINNTLFWKTVPFTVEAGGDVHFTVWNTLFGGDLTRMMFLLFGAAPLRLVVESGAPEGAAVPRSGETAGDGAGSGPP